jgi:cyclomaltodextrinase
MTMEHPGPPRFAAVGDEVELAPRDPDPDARYRWRVADAPTDSTVTLGEEPVEQFEPDEPGRYTLTLESPAGTHRLTVRVFGSEYRPGEEPTRQQYSGTEPPAPAETVGVTEEEDPAEPGSGIERIEDEPDPERPRLQLSGSVASDEIRVESRVAPRARSGEESRIEFLLDDRDGIDESAVSVDGGTLRVPRSAFEDRARIHAVVVGENTYSVPDAIDFQRDSAGEITVSRPYDPPEWALDSAIYEIYVRTFAGNGVEESAGVAENAFGRIRERLDYLDDLGVDVVWLTPVLQNDHAPHGYNITDFFAIASDLGSREDFENLVEAAHDREMRVVFDLVLNHSARAHPYFMDAYGEGDDVGVGQGSPNPESDYFDWYDWQESGEPETYFEWEHIANFDFDTLDVRRHLLDAVAEWFPLVDGFRCDMAWAVPNGFWREIHDWTKERDEEFLLLDETIPYIPEFQAGLFDMHFDSTTAFQLREIGSGAVPAESLLEAVTERQRIGFPDHASFMLYAENHDETRYIEKCGKPAALAAAGALATLPGAPMLYAGQELGQLGRRDALDWQSAHEDLQNHYRRLLDLRHRTPALAHRAEFDGAEYTVESGDPSAVVAYNRRAEAEENGTVGDDGERDVIVVLNFGDGPASVSLTSPVEGRDLVTDDSVPTDPVEVESVVVLPRN